MRLLVASDIHGSAFWTRRLLQAAEEENADQIALLGDVFYHGPRNPLPDEYAPLEVAKMLDTVKDRLIVVKGNCDSEVDAMVAPFEFVDIAQIYADGVKMTLTHGHVFNKDALPKNAGDVLLYGHFHTGFAFKKDGMVIANPGSVSLPKEGTAHSYIIIENGEVLLKDLKDRRIIEKEVAKQ